MLRCWSIDKVNYNKKSCILYIDFWHAFIKKWQYITHKTNKTWSSVSHALFFLNECEGIFFRFFKNKIKFKEIMGRILWLKFLKRSWKKRMRQCLRNRRPILFGLNIVIYDSRSTQQIQLDNHMTTIWLFSAHYIKYNYIYANHTLSVIVYVNHKRRYRLTKDLPFGK